MKKILVNIVFVLCLLVAVSATPVSIAYASSGDTLVINGADLNPIASTIGTSISELQYKETKNALKYTRFKVKANPEVYINNVEVEYTTFNLSYYPTKIEFVDNTDDDVFDIVNITIYEHAIVEKVDVVNERINFASGSFVQFDSQDSEQIVNIYNSSGDKINLSDVKSGDVLAMVVGSVMSRNMEFVPYSAKNFAAPGTNKKIAIINLGVNTVTGMITEADDAEGLVYINGIEYELAPVFVDGNYSKVVDSYGYTKLGTEGTFYLSIDSKIIGFERKSAWEGDYGYILQTAYNTGDAFSAGWQVKMLTTDGIAVYDLYKHVSINGAATVSSDYLTSSEPFFNSYTGYTAFNTTPSDNVVEYKLASDGTIKSISVVIANHSQIDSASFNADTNKLGNKVIAEDVIIFDITGTNADDAKTKDISTLVNKGIYGGEVFDNADGDGHKIFVMTSVSVSFDAQDNFNVVSSVRKTTYNDEDAVIVKYFTGGLEEEYTAIFTLNSININMGVNYTALQKGDVFIADVDKDGVVSKYSILAKVNHKYKTFSAYESAFSAAYGAEYKSDFGDGVAYFVADFVRFKNSVAYFDNEDLAFKISDSAAAYNIMWKDGASVIEVGDWWGSNIENAQELNGTYYSAKFFVKLYGGEVTDIYAYNEMADHTSPDENPEDFGDYNETEEDQIVESINYGYILQAAYNTGDAFSAGWQIKMLTEDGIAVYDLYKYVSINGLSAVPSNTITSIGTLFDNYTGSTAWNTTPSDNVVEYKLASDGTIKSIAVVIANYSQIDSASFNADTNKLGNKLLADDVLIFDLTGTNADDVKIKNISALVDGGIYGGELFDNADGDGYKVYVLTSGSVAFNAEAKFNVVSSVRNSIYNGDSSAMIITYYSNGEAEEKTAIFTADSCNVGYSVNYYELKKGDVFIAFADGKGVVSDYAILGTVNNTTKSYDVDPVSFSAAFGSEFKNNNLTDGVAYIVTQLKEIKNGIAYFEDGTDTDDYAFRIGDDVAAYSYSYEPGLVVLKADEWLGKEESPNVFLKLYDGKVTDIFAYNEMELYSLPENNTPATYATVTKTSDGCSVNAYADNLDTCAVFIGAYKGDSLVGIKSVPHSQISEPVTFTGDIDNIKVITVDSLSNLKPLTKSVEIPKSKWIEEGAVALPSGASLVVNSKDFNTSYSTIGASNTEIRYKESKDALGYTKIEVEDDATVYINGQPITSDANIDLSSYSAVEFIDCTNDNVFDIVNITIYEHAIVEEVDIAKERITFVDGSYVRFDSENSEEVVNIYNASEDKISLEDIKSGDVLAMVVHTLNSLGTGVINAKNFNSTSANKKITIYSLGANTVTGTITESNDSYGFVYINGEEYEMAPYFVDGNYSDVVIYGTAMLGTKGKFYLSINNEIIGFDGKSASEGDYGYILQTAYNTGDAFSAGWQVKMLTVNGIATYDLYKYVSINGASAIPSNILASTGTLFNNYTDSTAWNTTPSDNVVEYKLASDGTIKSIAVVTTNHASLEPVNTFNTDTNRFGNKLIADDVLIFDIAVADVDDVKIKDISVLVNKGVYGGEVFDNTDGDGHKVFVMTSKTLMFDAQAGFNVVKSVRRTTYDGDDNTIIVKYYTEGICEELIAIFTSASSNKNSTNDYTTLKIGDVFVANTDRDDVVSDYVVLAKVNEMTKSFDVVSGAFAAAYGPEFKADSSNPIGKLDDGVAYIVTFFKEIKNGIAYFEDGTATDDYGFRIGTGAAAYNFTADFGGDIVEAGDYLGSNIDNADMYDTNYDGMYDTYEAANVIIKLYDGEVTDIYSYNEMVPQLFFN